MIHAVSLPQKPRSVRPVEESSYAFSVNCLSGQEWDTILGRFADATIYQTHAYGAVRWGAKSLRHAVLQCDGQIVAAAQIRVAGFPSLGLGVAYIPWGPLWRPRAGAPHVEHFQKLVTCLVQQFAGNDRLLLRLDPFEIDEATSPLPAVLREAGFTRRRTATPRQTIHIDLTRNPEEIKAQLSKKWRENLHRSMRSNLELVEGTGDNLYETFRQLHSEMHERKQFRQSVSVAEFGAIQKAAPEQQKMRVILCRHQALPVAGLVWSAIGDTGIPVFSATVNEGLKCRGSYLVRWTMLLRLQELGCRCLDQGGVDAQKNPGGFHFKSGMGGQLVRHIGQYEFCQNSGSRWAVSSGEWLRKNLRRPF
jgi:hypothetical protein